MSLHAHVVVARGAWRLDVRLDRVDGVVAVLGPSGVGKTTLLHALAGLTGATGTVRIDDDEVGDLPAWKRRIGVVFQDDRLLPHLTVRGNLAFGAVDVNGVAPLAERLGVGHALDRRPSTLSGGEARRVALGRALLARPRALLLDEPLVGLDPERRADLLPWLRDVVRDAGLPTLWVTHDATEAQAVADRLIVLGERDGVVQPTAHGDASTLLAAGLRGSALKNPLDVVDVRTIDTTTTAAWGGVVLTLPPPPVAGVRRGRVLLAPEDPVIAVDPPGRTSARNVLPGVVERIEGVADGAIVVVVIGGRPLVVDVTRAAVAELGLAPGRAVHVLIKARALRWTR